MSRDTPRARNSVSPSLLLSLSQSHTLSLSLAIFLSCSLSLNFFNPIRSSASIIINILMTSETPNRNCSCTLSANGRGYLFFSLIFLYYTLLSLSFNRVSLYIHSATPLSNVLLPPAPPIALSLPESLLETIVLIRRTVDSRLHFCFLYLWNVSLFGRLVAALNRRRRIPSFRLEPFL